MFQTERAPGGAVSSVLPTSLLADGLLSELFERQVDATPSAIALLSGLSHLTYAQLDERANRLAHYLRQHGAGPGKFVGLLFERSQQPIVAILACLKSGAAYIPLDPAYPVDRIAHIATESEMAMLLTERSQIEKASAAFQGHLISLGDEQSAINGMPASRLTAAETGLRPTDLAYVIYTSGTTGRPKGVMAEHRNVYRFALAFNETCGTGPEDRIFQGFSLTFDGSVEEIWMAFSNGSALVVPERDAPRFGNDFGAYLAREGVTYFSTVPTMLSTITEPISTLRTLVVSGEICPQELVQRWVRPGLRMWNVYGPTEATVNTTAKDCIPGQPVTVGRPLRGYDIHILDEKMQPCAAGEKGELYVGGETLARGYLKQPEKTAESFLTRESGYRLYKTGDLVRWNEEGELEFFGRIDSQVKIRGFRVELAEIESVLLEHENIRTTAVVLRDSGGQPRLAAYAILRDPALGLDRNSLLAKLESRLPPYMIPASLDVLAEFPLLASGKTDRKLLPPPQAPLVRESDDFVAPEGPLEIAIAGAWATLFGIDRVSVDADFFRDLGGHSLAAAQVVTTLRNGPCAAIHVRDIYKHSTVRSLAAHLLVARSVAPPAQPPEPVIHFPFSRSAYFFCAAAQAVATYVLYGLYAIPFALVFPPWLRWFEGQDGLLPVLWPTLALFFLTWPVLLVLGVASKWLLIGRYQEGKHRLWGSMFFRWWLAGRLQAMTGAGALVGTPFLPLYLRLMGAKVGRNCDLDSAMFSSFDLISIGDETSIGADSQLLGYRIENGALIFGRVDLGSRCFVGIHSALGLGTRMEDDSRLDDQSLLPDGAVLARGEAARGSPALPAELSLPAPSAERAGRGARLALGLAQLTLAELTGLVFAVPLLPVVFLMRAWYLQGELAYCNAALAALVPGAFLFYAFFFILMKKLVLNRSEPGEYDVCSFFYLRKWLADGIVKSTKTLLLPLYTTIYFPAWLRLFGAKVGRRAEVSTLWYFSPDLIEIGAGSFFADGSIIGGKRFFRGRFAIGRNCIGERSFVGNSAILPVGQSLGNGSLLGVQSIPPLDTPVTPDNTDWLGSPAFRLPRRHQAYKFTAAETFDPTLGLIAQRCLIDGLRILIPGFLALSLGVVGLIALRTLLLQYGLAALLVLSPAVALVLGLCAAFAVIALKWLVMGRFEPVVKPLWSRYVWLNEMLNGAYESIMIPAIAPFMSTPFLVLFLRALGCRIGRGAYLGTTLFSEFDLVEVGDYAALNAGAVIQNHLFEDRIMKSSNLRIGEHCAVGNMAVVLYDSEMKPYSTLGPLSLLMKGEAVPAYSRSLGIPNMPEVGRPTGKAPEIEREPLAELLPVHVTG